MRTSAMSRGARASSGNAPRAAITSKAARRSWKSESRCSAAADPPSERHREHDGAQIGRVVLAVEFLGADGLGVGQSRVREEQLQAALQIADERPLRNRLAVREGIAVEEDVSPDGAAVEAGEHVPAEDLRRVEEIRARHGGGDARRAKVRVQPPADAGRRAGAGLGEYVADGADGAPHDVDPATAPRMPA